jgi:hypothetical protein
MIAAMTRRGHDPIAKFIRWLEDERRARIPNYEAMALATARSGKILRPPCPAQEGEISNSKPSSDLRCHRIPRISVAKQGSRRDPKKSRILARLDVIPSITGLINIIMAVAENRCCTHDFQYGSLSFFFFAQPAERQCLDPLVSQRFYYLRGHIRGESPPQRLSLFLRR